MVVLDRWSETQTAGSNSEAHSSSSYDISREDKRKIFFEYLVRALSFYAGQGNTGIRTGPGNSTRGQEIRDFYRVEANGVPELGAGLLEVRFGNVSGKDRYFAITEDILKLAKDLHKEFNKNLVSQGLGPYSGLEFKVDDGWTKKEK